MESTNWILSRFSLCAWDNVIAFAGNSETQVIILSSSGHPTIARHFTVSFGGRVWLAEEKMTDCCGYLGEIPRKIRSQVRAELCNYFKKEFRFV